MNKNKKMLIWVGIADLLLAAALFVMCTFAGKMGLIDRYVMNSDLFGLSKYSSAGSDCTGTNGADLSNGSCADPDGTGMTNGSCTGTNGAGMSNGSSAGTNGAGMSNGSCAGSDGDSMPDGSGHGGLGRASLTMEGRAGSAVSKDAEFGSDIYERQVIPSGEAMGIYMKTDGVMVVDVCNYKNEDGISCCPVRNVLQTGDYIVSIDGTPVSKRSEMLSLVENSSGADMRLEYIRDGETYSAVVTPQKNENGNYLLGAWVKDDVSGIGTITFIDGTSFMALGHSVSDVDTGLMMRCSGGGVYTTNITNISKSYSEQPGRLQGNIAYRRSLVGLIDGNSASGIYGHLDETYCSSKYSDAERMYIARGSETKRGKAYIYSRMSGELRKYEIDIEELDTSSDDKNIEFHVTDEDLLSLTGGVVQGMSGSPIIQDGRIIGAVTHVFVDDPTRGYGIFIDNMLEK